MTENFIYLAFKAGDEMIHAACSQIVEALKTAIAERGHASLMLSGGNSPRPVYEALSDMGLPWEKVSIGLIDDRWVNPKEAGSNERFLQETLLQRKASTAKFIGLKTDYPSPAAGLDASETQITSIPKPFDVCVMGMGLDGHTASWFPNSKGLEAAMDIDNPQMVAAIDARGCRFAGDHPDRITLTLSAVMAAKQIILIIPGTKKAEIFKASANKSVYDVPVKALRAAGEHLTVITDET